MKLGKSSSPGALWKDTGLMRKDIEYETEGMMALKRVNVLTPAVSDLNPESTQLRHKANKKIMATLSPSPPRRV
jgi:hypothetical protein